MELRLHARDWQGHAPDWIAAAVSGFLAGAVLMVLEAVWTLLLGNGDPWATARMVSALVTGPQVLGDGGFSLGLVVLALAIHYALGVVFGLLLAAGMALLHLDGSPGRMEFAGALFGLLLYLLNFHGMSYAFPWLAGMRGWSTLMAHLVFGISAALLYWKLRRVPAQG